MSALTSNRTEDFRPAANDADGGLPRLLVADIGIRQDEEGRYCLNDLHRASGGEKRHGPSYWLANTQTRALVDELATTGNPVVALEGAGGGTFVVKELVYAYATWISATFYLKVIRAYDALVTGRLQHALPDFSNPAAAARAWAEQYEQRLALKAEVEQKAALLESQKPAVAFVERYVEANNCLGIREVVKLLGVKEREFVSRLEAAGIMFRQGSRLLPYAKFAAEEKGYFAVKTGNRNDHDWVQAKFTPRGVVWIARKLYKRQMTEQEVTDGQPAA